MTEQVKNIICNGELEIIKITEELYDDAVKLFKDNFIQQENLCHVTNLKNSPQAVQDLQGACRDLLKGNISFAARNIANGELAAIAVNLLSQKKDDDALICCVLDDMESRELRCIREFIEHIENKADIYNVLQIDCVMEIIFLSTSSKYTKRSLASLLTKHSIEYAHRLKQGTLLPGEDEPAGEGRSLKPQAVCSLFTSLYTQRIGRKFGFEILAKAPYTEFSFDGKTFAERLDPIHECSTFEALRL